MNNSNQLFNRILLLTCTILTISSCKTNKSVNPITVDKEPLMCYTPVDDSAWYENENNKAPLFDDLGDLDFKITTKKKLVQKYFNQGLTLAYGFNHAEAARSFFYAKKLDPTAAMAYWGYAYVLGPNYNAGMPAENYIKAYNAIQIAKQLAKRNGNQKEIALTEALSKRYPKEAVVDRSYLDSLYSVEMRKVYSSFPNDPDVGTLYAESLLNLHPWDLWEDGEAKLWTPEILSILEDLIQRFPDHPGAHHFYIHSIEASNTPGKGLVSASALDKKLTPGAGHLIHMPSHIYIRTGDYHLGSLANIEAIKADSSYITSCRAQGAYPLIYHPHNEHFLAATATLQGKKEWAISSAEQLSETVARDLIKEPAWGLLQHFYTIPYYIYVKFGMWDKILQMPELDTFLIYPESIKSYAKGMAFLGKNDIESAEMEVNKLLSYLSDPNLKEISIGANASYPIVEIAVKVLGGEIEAAKGNLQKAAKLLKEGVEIEDKLSYIEPPDWFFSVRHHLGHVLLQKEDYSTAIQVFEEDLINFPKNGWALNGLRVAVSALGNNEKLRYLEIEFKKAWKHADVKLDGSRIAL